ncbi:valyl-tRNA synthetase [Thecamonas trahens ATCC 50062]|uniref:valine--tRNA ligase n=1 Tax=Thecamonas trahens ATCC 50062 TaxID=461836 RepID=A0A0L0D2I4_THETB|nr:valyl-tRNA synthetase [Thecamonas trahens ATCC 50062]KNC46401.1 valyl-tRNA synthetase [Thecamonas trahens ATCC 50062]|eukprot:XP_013760694.1 valyl-tRNA synthetase [Thecamonas trahens ATCC 50062]
MLRAYWARMVPVATLAGRRWAASAGAGGLAAGYEPAAVEAGKVARWEAWRVQQAKEAAKTGSLRRPTFTVLLPPPNVTGALHLGHALTVAVEDAAVRAARARGEETLWIPGLDHAGIATQVVVESKIQRERGISRHELGRDAFVREVHAWKEATGDGRIRDQLRMLGGGLDWAHEYFTMDPARSQAVDTAFMQLAADGLIYRDLRLVNWCPTLRSAISDVEVDHVDVAPDSTIALPDGRRVPSGRLYTIRYAVANSPSGETVAVQTTRPETVLVDTALAVHPDDPRHARLAGKSVKHPLTGALLPVVADATAVDPEFGTGVVKISPGVDFNDYATGVRHGQAPLTLFDDVGHVALSELVAHLGDTPLPAELAELEGVDRYEARARIIELLEASGAYGGHEPYAQSLAVCSRTGDVLEPLLRPQWFLRTRELAEAARKAVETGALTIAPASFEATWDEWMHQLNDWCLSRQLWWGHRVPAWRAPGSSGLHTSDWVFAADEAAASVAAAEVWGSGDVVRDDDVLDTWFSSALLPMSALGWPHADPRRAGYPLTLMETGSDILVFWVARMVMLCTHLAPGGELPFKHIDLHQMVRDKSGRKMSKSLGNVLDPADLIQGASLDKLLAALEGGNLPAGERARASSDLKAAFPDGFPAFGTDALRYALLEMTKQSHFINLDPSLVLSARKFCNKIWNGLRYVLLATEDEGAVPQYVQQLASGADGRAELRLTPDTAAALTPMDAWILSKLDVMAAEVQAAAQPPLALHKAARAVSGFFVDAFCDIYVEHTKVSKGGVEGAVLAHCALSFLTAAHPLLPFLTDELVSHAVGLCDELPASVDTRVAPLPEAFAVSPSDVPRQLANAAAAIDGYVLPLLEQVRSLRASWTPPRGAAVYVVSEASKVVADAQARSQVHALVARLAKAQDVTDTPRDGYVEHGAIEFGVGPHAIRVALTAEPGLALGQAARTLSKSQRAELGARSAKLEAQIAKLEKIMAGEHYATRVPAAVQAGNATKLDELRTKLESLTKALA